jgi:hypothetical protein
MACRREGRFIIRRISVVLLDFNADSAKGKGDQLPSLVQR